MKRKATPAQLANLRPFKPGQSGNPNGRIPGTRVRFTESFWRDLAYEWHQGGPEVLQKVRQNDPSTFLRVCASLMPKESRVTLRNDLDSMSDAELRNFIQGELARGRPGLEVEEPSDTGVTH